MKGPTPSQIKAAIEAATKAGAVRVRVTGEDVIIELRESEPLPSATKTFRFDHEHHDAVA